MSRYEHERVEEEAFQMNRSAPKPSMPTTVEFGATEPADNNFAPEPTTEQAPDPFDVEELQEDPFSAISVENVLHTVPVRRPKPREFFRVHPSPKYTVDAPLIEHEVGNERLQYWIVKELRGYLVGEFRTVRLFTCFSRSKVLFLWPAKLPTDGLGRAWSDSALRIAEEAKRSWVRMVGNRDLGAYDMLRAKGDLGNPEWPDKTLPELIKIGFQGRVIDSADHPVIREFEGKA